MQNLPKIIKLRRMPSMTTPLTVTLTVPKIDDYVIPTAPTIPELSLPPLTCPAKPPYCRFISCRDPKNCKIAGICHVDWEPELVKE